MNDRIPLYLDKKVSMLLKVNAQRPNSRKELHYLRAVNNFIENAHYLSYHESLKAVAYFVSLIENKKYSVEVFYPTLADPYYYSGQNTLQTKHLVCLVEEEKLEEATTEMKARFDCKLRPIFPVQHVQSEAEFNQINHYLQVPSDNYIQLTYGDNFINHFDVSNFIGIYYNGGLKKEEERNLFLHHSCLCDSRYSYILDFTDTLVMQQLEKGEYLTYLEMKEVAERLASTYKQEKLKIKV